MSEEDPSYTQLANSIQLTLFAVSKAEKRTRLISWPRVQNDALPDPTYTHLPEPSLFEAIAASAPKLSAYYLDVSNMFHNIILLDWLAKLFPLQTMNMRELDTGTLRRIKMQLPKIDENDNSLLWPCQATMPMSFKWAVFIAHSFPSACLDTAYKLFMSMSLMTSRLLVLCGGASSPTTHRQTTRHPRRASTVPDHPKATHHLGHYRRCRLRSIRVEGQRTQRMAQDHRTRTGAKQASYQ